MPRGNYRKREDKKAKKKPSKGDVLPSFAPPPVTVEIIKKKRKPPQEENF